MRFTFAAVATLLGLAVAVPMELDSRDGPSGHEVEIQSVTYSGSGCPPGSAVGVIDDSRTTMTISYSQFVAQSGPGVSPAQNRKNCNLNIKLKYPSGWQYSIFETDFRGYANIHKGDRGECKATYWFSGQTQQTSKILKIFGGYDDNYILSDSKGLATQIWSPCGKQGMLNINSEVRVVPLGTKDPNLMTVDTTDASFTQLVYFQWKKCPHP